MARARRPSTRARSLTRTSSTRHTPSRHATLRHTPSHSVTQALQGTHLTFRASLTLSHLGVVTWSDRYRACGGVCRFDGRRSPRVHHGCAGAYRNRHRPMSPPPPAPLLLFFLLFPPLLFLFFRFFLLAWFFFLRCSRRGKRTGTASSRPSACRPTSPRSVAMMRRIRISCLTSNE